MCKDHFVTVIWFKILYRRFQRIPEFGKVGFILFLLFLKMFEICFFSFFFRPSFNFQSQGAKRQKKFFVLYQ